MVENLKKNLIPIAIIVVGLLIAGAIFYNGLKKQAKPSELLSSQEVGEKIINYINENLLKEGKASLIEIVKDNGVYKIKIKIGDQEFTSYITLNGKLLFPQAVDLEEKVAAVQEEEKSNETSTGATPSPEKLAEYIQCLKKADFVIYGANWCGWTKQLVEMLGGWDTVKPIYVECTEKTQLCEEKGIKGFPTILINGKEYGGQRTFQGFKEATNCEIPSGAESLPQGNSTGGCQ